MYLKRIFTPNLSINSYVLGDHKTKRCLVMDPTRHVAPYIILAQNEGLDITDILETHVHADFVSGAKELKHQLNNKPCIHTSGRGGNQWIPAYTDRIIEDGDQLIMGDLRLEAIHTPGHTPEHLIWVCYDKTRSSQVPWFAFTGDCLLVGSVGRPDLLDLKEMPALAQQLYESLFERLAPLPDFVEILPSHSEGSLCAKEINGRSSSTLGYERLFNPYFKKQPKDEWMKNLQNGLPLIPPYFHRLKRLNVQGPSLLSSLIITEWGKRTAKPDLADFFLVDVRYPEAFASSHIKGSLNIPFSPSFSQWVGWMIPEHQPIGLIVENMHVVSEVVDQLRLMGFDQEICVIPLSQEPSLSSSLDSFGLMEVEDLAKHQPTFESLYVIDVRTDTEWQSGHILGAHHMELTTLESSFPHIPQEQSIALICRSGVRASLAASLLQKQGFLSLFNVRGGMQAWKQANLPIVLENAENSKSSS